MFCYPSGPNSSSWFFFTLQVGPKILFFSILESPKFLIMNTRIWIRNSGFEAVVGWSEGVRNLEFGALFSVPEIFWNPRVKHWKAVRLTGETSARRLANKRAELVIDYIWSIKPCDMIDRLIRTSIQYLPTALTAHCGWKFWQLLGRCNFLKEIHCSHSN